MPPASSSPHSAAEQPGGESSSTQAPLLDPSGTGPSGGASAAAGGSGQGEEARQAGRGGLALSAAKLFFIVFGLIQQIAITRLLGLDAFGAIRGALSPASITYNPLVTTGIQGMSHAVSGRGAAASQRFTYAVHALGATLTAAGFFLLAPWIGAELLQSPHLVRALQLGAVVILIYGLYAPLVGICNGRRQFLYQAGLDMLSAVLRTVGLVFGGWLVLRGAQAGPGAWYVVDGAMAGFAVSAALVLVLAGLLVRRSGGLAGQRDRASARGIRVHLQFAGPVLVGQVLLNLLLQVDTNTLRRFAGEAALGAELPTTAVDKLVGAYGAAQLFGFLPYQLLIGVSFILFPLLAKAHAARDRQAVQGYVQTGMRLALLVVVLLVSVSASLPTALLDLVFQEEAARLGGAAMQILVLGLGTFAVFGVLITVLNSLSRPWLSMGLTALALLLVLTLNWLLVSGRPFGPELLQRTAWATSCGMVLAMVGAVVAVRWVAGRVAPLATVLRGLLAVAVTLGVMHQLPSPGRLMSLVYAATAGSLCLGCLLLTRELTGRDWTALAAVFRRRAR